MRFLTITALLLALFATPLSVLAEGEAAVETGKGAPAATSTIEDMAAGVIGLFPRAEGSVLTSGDKSVRVAIGSKDGLKPGMTIYLTREGEPIIHPVTKVVLGYKDTELGVAVAGEVAETESVAEITELNVTQVVEGDTARLPTERERLLVTIIGKDYNELVVDGVLRRLRESNRFKISGPSEIEPDTLNKDGFLSGLAREGSADYVLLIGTSPTEGQGITNVSLKLVSADGETQYESSGTVEVTYEVFDENVMGIPLVRGERRDFFRIEDLPFRGMHMATGDVTGDGRVEIAVSDGQDIYVYRFTDGILRQLWTHRGGVSDDHLALDIADMDGDGRGEIYVTNFRNGHMASFVVEYDGEGFVNVFGPSILMFRVLEMPDGKKRLLTTTVGANSPYSGTINEYAWKDGNLEMVGPAGLPDTIKDPYGFVIVDVVPEQDKLTGEDEEEKAGEPEPEIVWVDDDDYVQVLDIDDGERIWKSPDRYGGYDTFFEPEHKEYILPNTDPRGKVKGNLIVREGPGGDKYVVLTKNLAMLYVTRRFRGYSGAEIHALSWDGKDMAELWSIKPINGYLADISIGEVLEERRDDVIILTAPTINLQTQGSKLPTKSLGSVLNLFEDSSTLLLYKIPMR